MRYWIGVASREHVMLGVAGGFCQLCHGKATPLQRMQRGDWLIYYSPVEVFGEKTPCQAFTAIGQIADERVYRVEMFPGFVPHRRDVCFLPAQPAPIRPLLPKLDFIAKTSHWGYAFRFGHRQISADDFHRIANGMLTPVQLSQLPPPKSNADINPKQDQPSDSESPRQGYLFAV